MKRYRARSYFLQAIVPMRLPYVLAGMLAVPAALTSACSAAQPGSTGTDSMMQPKLEVLGYIEHVRVEPLGLVLPAKLDTGATTSSIDARDLQPFSKKGEAWIRFTIPARGKPDKPITLERRIVRDVRIKQHGQASRERPVVELTLCFGHQAVKAQVTLADRTKYSYPLLLGRNHMRGHIVVDPSRRYTTEPVCGTEK